MFYNEFIVHSSSFVNTLDIFLLKLTNFAGDYYVLYPIYKNCKENNVKPTPLIKSLGLSTGNLKKWSEGATVNSDILAKLAEYFNVPVDYFFEDDEEELNMIENFDYINSMSGVEFDT